MLIWSIAQDIFIPPMFLNILSFSPELHRFYHFEKNFEFIILYEYFIVLPELREFCQLCTL